MEICWRKERTGVERAKVTTGSKAAWNKMKFSRKQQGKWMERYEISREVLAGGMKRGNSAEKS